MMHLDVLQIPIDLGALLSFFSLALSCMNAGARVVYRMGRQGFFHEATGNAHATNEPPHIASAIYALLQSRSRRSSCRSRDWPSPTRSTTRERSEHSASSAPTRSSRSPLRSSSRKSASCARATSSARPGRSCSCSCRPSAASTRFPRRRSTSSRTSARRISWPVWRSSWFAGKRPRRYLISCRSEW